jgi:glycosyltransferase involved in cell wall biosynthesis
MNSFIKNNILVSVIIPCYNVQDYIEKCIKSVLNQTYKPIEIICVDNNSNDKTYSILSNFESESKIKVYKCFDKGANYARNLGTIKSKGNWIQFLDADDILLPEKIEFQVREILKNTNIDVIFSPYIKRSVEDTDTIISCNEIVELGLLSTKLGITSSNLFKSSKLKSCGMWEVNQNSSQEYELMYRMYKIKAIFRYSRYNMTLIQSRKTGQISTLNLKENWERYIDLRLEMLNFFNKESRVIIFENQNHINQVLFDLLRILYKFNQLKALDIYNKYLQNFSPQKSESTGYIYIFIYNIFGFSITEKIRRRLYLD